MALNLKNFDTRLVATLALPAALFVVVIVLFIFGKDVLGLSSQEDVEALIHSIREAWWAPIAVFAIFTIVGLTGFPQFMLMAAVVVIFGPMVGFFYAWLATVFSSYVGFMVGHFMGHKVVRKYGGERMNRVSQMLGENGIFASILVRVIPTAPFAVVNLVAGASHINFMHFAIGTVIGVIPKAALLAYVGASFFDFVTSGDPVDLLILAVVLGIWVFAGMWLQKMMKSSESDAEDGAEDESEPAKLSESPSSPNSTADTP